MSLPVPLSPPRFRLSLSRRARGGIWRTRASGWLAVGLLAAVWLVGSGGEAGAQILRPMSTPAPPGSQPKGFFFFRPQPQRPVAQTIAPLQEGPKINSQLMDLASPDNTNVIVSLPRQRVYLMMQGQVVLDSPISSGKAGHRTPSGSFRISEKELNHFSNIYGNFVDRTGRVVRSGVSSRIDSAPSGTRFEGAPMRFFMRLTDNGVGMHIGILPGYAASHGCVRLPTDIAPLIYSKVKIGTSVVVQD